MYSYNIDGLTNVWRRESYREEKKKKIKAKYYQIRTWRYSYRMYYQP